MAEFDISRDKSEIENSENGFHGDQPAADPDVETVKSVVDDLGARC